MSKLSFVILDKVNLKIHLTVRILKVSLQTNLCMPHTTLFASGKVTFTNSLCCNTLDSPLSNPWISLLLSTVYVTWQ